MHLAFGASLQRHAALLRDNDGVLGMAAAEVDTHAVGGLGPARALRHGAQVLQHSILPAFLWGGPWHGFAVGDGRTGRGKRGEASGANAVKAFSMGTEQGASKVCPAFGAVDSTSLAFSIAIALTGHASLVSLVAHASGTGGRQANHQFRLCSVSFLRPIRSNKLTRTSRVF